ncbi:MAG: nicotinamide riboside transporter PnuC [Bacteroidota bacterium]
MLNLLLQNLQALSAYEWWATVTALVYVILSARNNPWCWPFGIVSCALWAYVSYYQYNLYADALLQVFYVIMGFVGLYQWVRPSADASEQQGLPITTIRPREHLYIIIVGITGGVLLGYFFSHTAAAATYFDAVTTSFAVLATFLLIQRRLTNWWYWIVVDVAYTILYWQQGAYLFSLLMVSYVFIAAYAYQRWKSEMENYLEKI